MLQKTFMEINNMRISKSIYISIVSFVIGVFITSMCFYIFKTDKKVFVYVSIENVIAEISTQLANRKLGDDALQVTIEKSKEIFREEIESYASANNAAVISSEKIIAGIQDITEEIKSKVIKRLE